MTFTEAAVEVLRRAGKPLHYKEIAEAAVRENLLSHVGQDPETTMGHRLAAMARREEERRVVAIDPDGTFALTEWSVPAELVVEAEPPPVLGDEGEQPYRPREREPRPIHPQARRRMEAIAAGEEPGEERRERPERERPERERGAERKRPLVAAEAVFEWLAQRQSGAPLAEVAADFSAKGLISEGLANNLPSLTAALLEDNRRRTEAGRKPAFIVDGERVTLVEFPSPAALTEVERSPQTPLGRPAAAASLVAEGRRACVRALRSRLADLETAGFEHVCAALLEKMGMRDLRVAKRSKDGPLYLARQRWGVSDLRVAVKLVRGRREIGRADVTELRKDLAHYSAQMAMLLAPGEAGREARADASAAAQAPVALFAGEALAEELVDLRVGVSVEVVEIADVDEAFFAAARALKGGRDGRGPRDASEPRAGEPGAASSSSPAAPSASFTSSPSGSGSSELLLPASTESQAQAERAPAEARSEAAPSSGEPARAAAESPAEPRAAEAESRDGRRRPRREKEERPRLASPADQAWGQPAGTPKKGAETLPAPRSPGEGAGTAAAQSESERASEAAASSGSSGEVASAPDAAAPVDVAASAVSPEPAVAEPGSAASPAEAASEPPAP